MNDNWRSEIAGADRMRGEVIPQGSMFSYVSPERRIPADHPLRSIKAYAEQALRAISAELEALYGSTGRPSIAPERLLKGQLLIALYSVRSDRAFCEQLDYNLLYRWFLDMSLDEAGLDQSNFSRLRERLVDTEVARRFFEQVLGVIDGSSPKGVEGPEDVAKRKEFLRKIGYKL